MWIGSDSGRAGLLSRPFPMREGERGPATLSKLGKNRTNRTCEPHIALNCDAGCLPVGLNSLRTSSKPWGRPPMEWTVCRQASGAHAARRAGGLTVRARIASVVPRPQRLARRQPCSKRVSYSRCHDGKVRGRGLDARIRRGRGTRGCDLGVDQTNPPCTTRPLTSTALGSTSPKWSGPSARGSAGNTSRSASLPSSIAPVRSSSPSAYAPFAV